MIFRSSHVSRIAFRQCGLTLIETLAAIAIIGVLAVLLISSLGKIRSRADASACLSNLRQVAGAGITYANENNGGLPLSTYNRQEGGMMQYLDYDINYTGKTALTCPALQRVFPTRTYHFRTTSINLITTQGHSTSRKNLRVFTEPSKTIFFLDGLLQSPTPTMVGGRPQYSYHSGAQNSADFQSKFQFPHGDRCAVAYLDGHVEVLSRETLLNPDTLIPLWQGYR